MAQRVILSLYKRMKNELKNEKKKQKIIIKK